jgi:hypothetical protein
VLISPPLFLCLDICPREALTAWAAHLRAQCPVLMFRSATAFLPEGPTMQDPLYKKVKGKGKAKIPIDDALGAQPILDCLSQWAKEKEGEEALTVAVVGVANVRLFTVFCRVTFSFILNISLGGKKFFNQFSAQTSGITYLYPCLFVQRAFYNRDSSRSHSRS